jgi:ketosteroid isomerase-like protein
MKPTLIFLAALVATLHTVGQGSRTAQTQAVKAVLATDRQLDRAWNDKDLAALDQLWADDYLFIGWTGIMDKHQRLAAIRSGKVQVQSVESDKVKVRVFNDVAFLTDRERIRTKQGEITVRSTRAFIFRSGRWQLITAQKNTRRLSVDRAP